MPAWGSVVMLGERLLMNCINLLRTPEQEAAGEPATRFARLPNGRIELSRAGFSALQR
ncbi:hypothetical protein [Pelagerythrobacter marensis]|uniref:hypothetical protein n=1 Tax=Pelagerythrobacter marensis TaxID=543877 RepID=UPI0012E07C25|nr:hypothetical protein [Pelagerythrobacter marensis]